MDISQLITDYPIIMIGIGLVGGVTIVGVLRRLINMSIRLATTIATAVVLGGGSVSELTGLTNFFG